MKKKNSSMLSLIDIHYIIKTLIILVALILINPVSSQDNKLIIYLLAGQSNMEGHANAFRESDEWYSQWIDPINFPMSFESLIDGTQRASDRRTELLNSDHFDWIADLDDTWLKPRNDVWAVNYNRNTAVECFPGPEPESITSRFSGIGPLSLGWGVSKEWGGHLLAKHGPELGMGHKLGDNINSPVFLFKQATGGTSLVVGNPPWRSPETEKRNGGSVGFLYTALIENLSNLLKDLDADLADDGVLNDYLNATGYTIGGFFWLQGWNDRDADLKEYEENLVDLVKSIRSDFGYPNLPAIVVESSDPPAWGMNTARIAAVNTLNAEKPGTAVFIDLTEMKAYQEANLPQGEGQNSHFRQRPESYAELGWRVGQAILDSSWFGDANFSHNILEKTSNNLNYYQQGEKIVFNTLNISGNLFIYNIHGQLLKEILIKNSMAVWNLKNLNQNRIKNQVFFAKFITNTQINTIKLMVKN